MHTVAESPHPLAERVSELTERLRLLWWDCPTDAFPDCAVPDLAARDLREAALERLIAQASSATAARVTNAEERLALQQQSMAAFAAFAHEALGFEAAQLATLERGFMPALAAFAEAARRFDPTLSGADIFQAGRNVSILNSLQLMLGLPVALTPSITAYSLLYPYTDNYLDDPAIPATTKVAFNGRLRRRLQGEALQPANAHEQAVWALVAMIEGQYPRDACPAVYASLLAIQRAQERSVALLREPVSPYEVDVLGITLEKGGASVLADGYLVAGTLSPAQEELLFGWGAFLQLADDLQDVNSDAHDGLATVFA
ncbi:MAG: hypothetical protein GX557_07900 [Chloroflexi bacterium]|nr:hypothetical protein [Chloroflexota bacterium]